MLFKLLIAAIIFNIKTRPFSLCNVSLKIRTEFTNSDFFVSLWNTLWNSPLSMKHCNRSLEIMYFVKHFSSPIKIFIISVLHYLLRNITWGDCGISILRGFQDLAEQSHSWCDLFPAMFPLKGKWGCITSRDPHIHCH